MKSKTKSKKFYTVFSVTLSILLFIGALFYGAWWLPENEPMQEGDAPQSISAQYSTTLQIPAYASRKSTLKTLENTLPMILETPGTNLGLEVRFLLDGQPIVTSTVTQVSGDSLLLTEVLAKVVNTPVKLVLSLVGLIDFEALNDAIQQYQLAERITLTGIEKNDLEKLNYYMPNIPFYLDVFLDMSQPEDAFFLEVLAKDIKKSKAIGVNIHYRYVTEDLVNIFRSNHLLISIYTIDSHGNVPQAMTMNVDHIITHSSDVVLQIEKIIEKK